jgi:class 3 adenylate cyclase
MAEQENQERLTPVTVVFVDISGSTALYAERGDAAAFRLTKTCLDLVAAQVAAAGGRVLRRIGDGVLAVFETPVQGLLASMRIVETIEHPACPLASEGVRVHVGLSSGLAVLRASDVYGDVANVAARLLGHAGAGEILLSANVYEALPVDARAKVQPIDEMELRNRRDSVMVYKVVGESPQTTIRARTLRHPSTPTMHLSCGGRDVLVGAMRPRVTMGRDAANDICVDDDVVSRHHAEIALRGARFMLAPMLRLVRDELALTGTGRIALGVDETPHPILYRVTPT